MKLTIISALPCPLVVVAEAELAPHLRMWFYGIYVACVLTFCNRLSPAIIYFPPGYGNINLINLNLSYYFPIALTLYRHQSQLTTLPKWSETPVTPQQLRLLQDSRALLSSVSSSYNALKTSILIRRIQDADPYGSNGNWFTAQDNLLVVNVFSFLFHWPNYTNSSYRSVRNFVIDLRQMPATTTATGFHWQVAQATSLYNIVVEMSTASGNAHRGEYDRLLCNAPWVEHFLIGMYMENGSGGFMGGGRILIYF